MTVNAKFRLQSWDTRLKGDFRLNRNKILIGSHPTCDICLPHLTISPHHCYLFVKDDFVHVVDLESANGVFINGMRVKQAELFFGDKITIGDLAFKCEELQIPENFVDVESNVKKVVALGKSQKSVMTPTKENLTLIDEEYCDLELHDRSLLIGKPLALGDQKVTLDPLQSLEEPLEIESVKSEIRVEIMTYTNGSLVDIAYFDPTQEKVILSKDAEYGKIWLPGLTQQYDLLRTKGPVVSVVTPEGFNLSGQVDLTTEWTILTKGVHQISLRIVERTIEILPVSAWVRSKDFYQQVSKITAAIFVPFLLLLFIKLPKMEPEPVKQVTIVYKPVEAPQVNDGPTREELAAQETTSQTENTGTKSEDQPQEKTQMAEASAAALSPTPSKEAPAPKSVAQTKAASADVAPSANPTPAKPKAFKFKSSLALDSVVADAAPSAADQGSGRSTASFKKGIGASQGALSGVGRSAKGVNIGKLGSDAAGTGLTSSGAKGLVSKRGFDHSYLEPKTVVLGSIDPELLRKILQEYLPQFRHCYQQELVTSAKDLKGVIDLDFTIGANGKVSKTLVKAKDVRFSKKGMDCMSGVLRIIDFPKPKGGGVVDVRQPLNFFSETEKF
jgi:pSer/pThr/pTyr-binding forkhead associated (FHA) protein